MQNIKTINLREAMELCNYELTIKNEFTNFIESYYDNKTQKYYLFDQNFEKIILLRIKISTLYNGQFFDVVLLIYFPTNFPFSPPDIFFQKFGKVRINPNCLFYIDENSLRINFSLFYEWSNKVESFKNLINELKNQFNNAFPIFNNSKDLQHNDFNDGYCILDMDLCTLIEIAKKNIIPIKNVNKRHVSPVQNNKKYNLNFENKKIFDKEEAKKNLIILLENEIYNKIERNFEKNVKIKNKMLMLKNDLNKKIMEVDALDKKSHEIHKSITNVSNEIKNYNLVKPEHIKNINLSNIDSFLLINHKKYYKNIAKIKTVEEYILICKKAFERNRVDFNTAINLIRKNSREIFYLKYQNKHLINEE